METDLLKYLKEYGRISFKEKQVNEIDILILVQLLYMNFDAIRIDYSKYHTWHDLIHDSNYDLLFTNPGYGSIYRKLFEAVWVSKRFENVKFSDFKKRSDIKKEVQFAAITYYIEDKACIVFRGTDGSFVGWKEDFNIAFMNELPSQKLACEYLLDMSFKWHGTIIVAGHSKGGTLASYGATRANRNIQKRIEHVYSYDGPGFQKQHYISRGYYLMAKKIIKFVPKHSIFGMIMSQKEYYHVVQSNAKGIYQHDPLTWKIENGSFVYEDEIDNKAIRIKKRINNWLESLNLKDREEFVQILFGVLETIELDDIAQLASVPKNKISRIVYSISNLSKEKKDKFLSILLKLLK